MNQPFPYSPPRKFDDPFLTRANEYIPDTLETALHLCRFLYYLCPQYAQAASRVVSYFITDLDYPKGGSTDEHEEIDYFLKRDLGLFPFLREVGDEWSCYGNGFVRVHFPFDRFLWRKDSAGEFALSMFDECDLTYHADSLQYEGPDLTQPNSSARVRYEFRDRKSLDHSRIRLRKLNPEYVTLEFDVISGARRVVYRFEPQTLSDVKDGRLSVVNHLPTSMLRAIKNEEDYRFHEDAVFHFKAPTISGMSTSGWGIPGPIANMRNIFQLQVYRKADEAIATDYMLPFRLFSPESGTSTRVNDALNMVQMPQWTAMIKQIIDSRRLDKYSMHSLPFPVNYQEFGGDGKKMAPHENIEYQQQALYEGMGIPMELYKGSVSFVQIPTALRLFESNFSFIHEGFADLVQWTVSRIRKYMGQEDVRTVLQRPTIADSLERKQILLQWSATGDLSRETAFDAFGVDNPNDEFKKRLDEDMERQRLQIKAEHELNQEMETGQLMAAGGEEQGTPGSIPGLQSAAPGTAVTPGDVQTKAQAMAEFWLSLDQGSRNQAMQSVKSQDPQLYALAKQFMEDMRSQGASMGRQQVNAQFQGGGAPMG